MENQSINTIISEAANFYNSQIENVIINMDKEEDSVKNITLNWLPAASCFQGRLDIFAKIKQLFESNKLVVLHGMPGIGKTETARHFGINNREYYHGNLIWVYAETSASIKRCFRDLTETLNLKVTDPAQIYNKFNTSTSLFVFDNVENMTTIRNYLPSNQLHPTVHVLITSRHSEFGSTPSISLVRLDPLDETDALDVFKEKLGDKFQKYNLEKWIELVEKLDRIPLCLQIVSSLVQQQVNRIRLAEFNLESYIQTLEEIFISSTIPEFEQNYYNISVLAAINSALSRLEKEKALYSLDLLCFTAYLDVDYIFDDDLLEMPSLEESPALLEEAFNKLVDYSLIQVIKVSYTSRLKIKIHRTIQMVLRDYDSEKRDGYFFKAILRISLTDTFFFHIDSLFRHAKKKDFLKKITEFYYDNESLVHKLLMELARYNCNEALQIIVPDFKKKYSKTGKFNRVFFEMLFQAIENEESDLKAIQNLIKNVAQNENYVCFIDIVARWQSIQFIDLVLQSNIFKNKINWRQTMLRHLSCSSNIENTSEDYISFKNTIMESLLRLLVSKSSKENVKETIICIEHLTSEWEVNILFQDDDSDNILHTACRNSKISLEVIKCLCLVEKGKLKSLVDCRNKLGQTSVHYLFLFNNKNLELFDIFCYFLNECKTDITIPDQGGRNILFLICWFGSCEMVDYILRDRDCSKIINIQDNFGNVPFYYLIRNQSIEELNKIKLFNLFFKLKIDFNLRNKKNETLFELARKENLMTLAEEIKIHLKDLPDESTMTDQS